MDHKKLDVWNESIALVKLVYEITEKIPNEEKYGLTQQIRRAATSIPSNIAEGAARKSDKENLYFLSIARGSLAELDTQLFLAKELFGIENNILQEKIILIGKLISGLVRYLSKKNNLVEEDVSEYNAENITSSTIHNSQLTNDYYAHETAVIDDGCKIGAGTKIWHFTHIMNDSVIGEKCNLGQNVVVSPEVVLGNNVKVQNNVSIYTGVICEDDVFLGPSLVFTNVINPRSAVNRKSEYLKTIVKRGATLGANATIVCGITIGEFAFVGAGAVVLKDVKPYQLVVGNPSKPIGWMSEFGHRLNFDNNNIAVCPESKAQYKLENESVSKL